MLRNGLSKIAAALLAVSLTGTGFGPVQQAVANPLAEGIRQEISKIFDLHRQAVVRVRASDAMGVRLGSGFFVDSSGTVYTHSGVVMQAEDVSVNFQGRTIPATIIASDPRTGIALLRTSCTSPFIPVGDSDGVAVSSPVIAIGFPGEFEASPALGLIAGRDFHRNGKQFCTSHLRSQMAVEEGYGGAPVVDFGGNVIGIVAARTGTGGSCYILPIGAAEKIRNDIQRFGELRPGWFGVEVEDAPEPVAGSTARVIALMPGSPAAKFGVAEGDILTAINGRKVCSIQDLVDATYFLTAGEGAQIQVSRGGSQLDLSVMPALHPGTPVPQTRADSGQAVPN
jgi:serine protease Do